MGGVTSRRISLHPAPFARSMLPLKRPLVLILLALVCGASLGFAQIGDNADKLGAPQVPLVSADKIPPGPALTPEQALKAFTLRPGFKLEIAAAEPLVQDPVAMTFGPDGRIVVLTDRDGDGRYDESKVFVDNLILPRALALVAAIRAATKNHSDAWSPEELNLIK